MNTFKKLLILFLTVTISLGSVVSAAASNSGAEILTVYQDGMIFNQKKTATIEGKANPGSIISIELVDNNGNTVKTSSAQADSDGVFLVSFIAPEGSFKEYSIRLYENNICFRTLKNIVFGELWLASGQSNMQYPLAQSPTGAKAFAENKKLNEWLRVLLVPAYPEYNGSSTLVPVAPQNDISDAVWVNGENAAIYSMSAVAYFFAEKLMNELGMPVGILNSSLGGSSIRSWLSREAIDNTPEVKKYLSERGEYIEESAWSEENCDIYRDMTANFNQKIAPLSNFSISGMIWYQGETDLMLGNTQYDKQFDLLQECFTEVFGYEKGLLPVVYTQLASYYYSDDGIILSDWNSGYCTMQKAHSNSRALVTIYDVPVTFLPDAGSIHPERKEEVGERMAYCASGLVYGKSDTYTAATVKSYTAEDNCMVIEFDNIADGLICTEKSLKGFAIADENGIFVNAQAEIISENTIKVFSEEVNCPVAVSYAYCVANQDANLYASDDGKPALPVAPFITDRTANIHYWFNKPWAHCDNEKIWYTEGDSLSGYYNAWTAKNADISFREESAFSGDSGININADSAAFSVSPTLSYKEAVSFVSFSDADTDYSDYGTMSFYIRNESDDAVKLEQVKFLECSALWYAPAIKDTLDCAADIPADGEWHKITLDLNRVYHLGNECSLSYSNDKLRKIRDIEFSFSSSDKNAKLSVDNISFAPSADSVGTRYDIDINNADNPLEFFTAIFLSIFGKLMSLFGI